MKKLKDGMLNRQHNEKNEVIETRMSRREERELERIRKEREERKHHLEFLAGCKTILEEPPKPVKRVYDMSNLYVFDFESTVYEGQTSTCVWAAGRIGLFEETDPDNVTIDNNLDDFMERCLSVDKNTKNGSLNLKFDGAFILNWLIKNNFQRYERDGVFQLYDGYMPRDGYYSYIISNDGQWYSITVSKNGHYHTFFDLYKLLPFSVEDIGKNMETKYRKCPEIDYKAHKSDHEEITKQERFYLACDCLVIQEAYRNMVERGYQKTTISACAMEEYKKFCVFDYREFRKYFVDLTMVECPVDSTITSDKYIRKSYHGGFCWYNERFANKIVKNGFTLDVNSLYPYVLMSKRYPLGSGTWFKGEIPQEAYENNRVFVVRIKAKFQLKKGHLPTIQIKGNPLYKSNEWLETSKVNGSDLIKVGNKYQVIKPELTLTSIDYELLHRNYDVEEEILDGVWFNTQPGLFDFYMKKYAKMKMEATDGCTRFIAKLFMNSLGGRFGADRYSSVKTLTLNGGITREAIVETEKEPGYIPVATFMTSYARQICILTAESFGLNHICYCDTDSVHVCNMDPKDVKDVNIDDKLIGAWKVEGQWDQAKFFHQKCYIEHIIAENFKPVDQHFIVKAAGLSKRPASKLAGDLTAANITLQDIVPGYKVKDNLKAVNIDGGVILTEQDFVF